ncbi:MAG: polyphosphate kinase 1 [Deltaproteobacteria bacterium]|nr:polyphosphate kinase 1 [Deltaproteobacteria bacterium]
MNNPATAPAPPVSMPTTSVAQATSPATPEAAASTPSLDEPRLFINRELSWLAFNERVLEEGRNPQVPIVERLKFVAIVASNLDEFFMVRVAGLKQQLSGEIDELPPDGMSVPDQLAAISLKVHAIVDKLYATLQKELLPELARYGTRILRTDELTDEQRKALEAKFFNDVFPILTPLAIDPGHPFPHLRNKSINLAVAFARDPRDETNPGLGVVQVPSGIPRLVPVPSATGRHYLLLEDLIALHVTAIFPMQRIEGCWPFRVTRNWDLAVDEEEAEDLLQVIQQELRRRDRGNAVRLAVQEAMSPRVTSYLVGALKLDERHDVYRLPSPLQLADMMSLVAYNELRELRDEPFQPVITSALKDLPDNDEFFGVLKERDVLLHQPYDSFESVVEFVQRAAEDPQVLAIKQTLYRTSGDSPIVRALARAAEQGKQVTAIVELKARFDEESNIQWARALEAAGVHVVYGVIGLKTHAKACLVVRREGVRLVRYVHLSTGNYNPATARLYTDLSLLTARPEFGEDVGSVFNLLTGYSAPQRWNVVVAAPLGLHEAVLGLIERETRNAREGKPASILAKLNALVDLDVIKALYRASQAGVKIDLLVRGICCLRPGVKGVSENIRVRATVDRFLEHSRVLEVANAGSPEIYVSSADWMPRNFHRRIELMFPILDEGLKRRIHEELLVLQLADNTKAWQLRADGTYERVPRSEKDLPIRSQGRSMELARERARAAEVQVTRVGRLFFAPAAAPAPPKGVPFAKTPPKRKSRRNNKLED